MTQTYHAQLEKKVELSPHVVSFHFTRHNGFDYKPGQYVKVTVPLRVDDNRGDTRFFTIASAPTEKDIIITTKMQDSEFKKSLYSVEVGDTVRMRGPFGSFVLDEQKKQPTVFISGGLGITPFRSMLRYVHDKNIDIPITHFISYPSYLHAPYLDEVMEIAKKNSLIKLIPFFTQDRKDDIHHEKGRITQEKLKLYVEKLYESVYYVTGPTEMVDIISSALKSLGISEEFVHREYFSGYQYE